MTLPMVDIIIVNWNSGDYLYDCLSSITKSDRTCYLLDKVIVIDNASNDNSLAGIKKLALPIKIIANDVNMGFAYACNQGAKQGDSDYLLFLNPDTQLYQNSLNNAIAFMEEEQSKAKFHIMGIQLIDDDNNISRSCARFPKPSHFVNKILGLNMLFPKIFKSYTMTDWDHSYSREVDQVIGAFFLVRRSLFNQLGGFDERFFVYYEEVDFSLRAKKLNRYSYYSVDVKAYHAGGGTTSQVKSTRLFYSIRSRLLYCKKHFSFISFLIVLLITIVFEPISRMLLCILRQSCKEVFEVISAYLLLWRFIPSLLINRM